MKLRPASTPPLIPNARIAPWPLGEYFSALVVPLARLQAGVRDPLHLAARLEPLRDRERVLRVTLHADAQRLQPLEEQEALNGESAGPMSRWYWSRALRMYCAGRSGSGSCEKTRPW